MENIPGSNEQNAHHLLDVLARQLWAFEHGRAPDMTLVRAVVDGLNRYLAAGSDGRQADLRNDLSDAESRLAEARLALTTEYAALSELGEHCLKLIDDIINGTVLPHSAFLVPARRYLRLYRSHLRREHFYFLRDERGTDGKRHGARQMPAAKRPRRS